MTPEDLMTSLARLRRAQIGRRRAPHKPLLVLWLLARFRVTGTTAVVYEEAEEPVSRLINDFGPAVSGPSRARERAAMPFVHLERALWDLRDSTGQAIGSDVPERGGRLRAAGAHGRLRPGVEKLLADSATLASAARLLLDEHFTPTLQAPLCAALGWEPAVLEAAQGAPASSVRRTRRPGFSEEVLRAYAYACAFCGYDGMLGRNPVGLEAAHIRWHSQDGPDTLANALALCALHHTLFDFGVLGLSPGLHIQVSPLYVARSHAGHAIDSLHRQPLTPPRPGRPGPDPEHIRWHHQQVFKHAPTPVAW
ncbi:phosphorothioated DNA-binding restriction endonuclease [Streptomyces avermitilis]|uniref:phosphorothioated DNA-binding restriction endonuclease n=1 Tax=Streptomyces avermitilis TaxID=33903 RepID=UPI0033B17B34